ncbi:hypothetical protein FGB62_7g227 [Gracilaria domingensis]|nr:hypothetical protein FGB62_7g227 [Gracilaria domingensis]
MTVKNICSFLEKISKENASAGYISFAIYAKCSTPENGNTVSRSSIFRITGPQLPSCTDDDEAIDIDLLGTETNESEENAAAHLENLSEIFRNRQLLNVANTSRATTLNMNALGRSNSNMCSRSDQTVMLCPEALERRRTYMSQPPVSKRPFLSSTGTLDLSAVRKQKIFPTVFKLSPEAVAGCLSLLLDASSITLHASAKKLRTTASVNARISEKMVTSVFQKQKEKKKRKGANVSGLKYTTLLPTQLQGNNVILELPILELVRTNHKAYRVLATTRTSLTVSKASKNSKETNIALLSFMWLNEGEQNGIRRDMERFARKGLLKCRNVFDCKERCTNEALYTNAIYICGKHNADERLGSGTVDPFATYVLGREIPANCVLVKLREVHNPSMILKSEYKNLSADQVVMYPLPWKRICIQRVVVRNEFCEMLGTAIMVRERVVHNSISEKNNMDIRYACELCDFVIHEAELNTSMTEKKYISRSDILEMSYPFAEWYEWKSLAPLRKKHFDSRPVKISHLLQSRAFIWHRNHISQM